MNKKTRTPTIIVEDREILRKECVMLLDIGGKDALLDVYHMLDTWYHDCRIFLDDCEGKFRVVNAFSGIMTRVEKMRLRVKGALQILGEIVE